MIYCMSDIHGRIDLFEKMLEQINLKNDDMLYIIGDCINRGGGLKVLEKIKKLSDQGNATLLMGNHEILLLESLKHHLSDKKIGEAVNLAYEYEEKQNELNNIIQDYSDKRTLAGVFMGLTSAYKKVDYAYKVQQLSTMIEDSIKFANSCSSIDQWESFKDVDELPQDEAISLFDFLDQSFRNITKEITVNGNHFLLVHGGLGENTTEQITIREEFYTNPVNKELLQKLGYNPNCKIIFGHTTTRNINIILNHKYIAPHKIWHDERFGDKIGIDCGASYPNGQLACLRLDDMKEFYVKNEEKYITPIYKINWCFDSIKKKIECEEHYG